MSIVAAMARRIQDIARYRAIGVVLGRGVGKSGTVVAPPRLRRWGRCHWPSVAGRRGRYGAARSASAKLGANCNPKRRFNKAAGSHLLLRLAGVCRKPGGGAFFEKR
jgi:hypothetical protein